MPTYDPGKVLLSVAGIRISGFKDEDIEVAYTDEDAVKENVGIQGEHSFTENRDQSGTIKFTLKETSPSNVVLEGFDLSRTAVPVLLKDTSDAKITVLADACRVKNRPTRTRGKEEGGVEWVLAAPVLVRASI